MSHPAGRPAARFIPRLEALEERRLLSGCTLVNLGNGALRVLGTRGHNHIKILDNGTAAVNNVTIVCQKQTLQPNFAVSTVELQSRGGTDLIAYVLKSPLLTGVTRNVVVHLASSRSAFTTRLTAGLQTRAALTIQANGGDTLSLLANNNIPIAARAALNVALTGGSSSADVFRAVYKGQLLGSLTLFEQGGPGPDRLDAQVTLTPGSTGAGAVNELGGAGDDLLVANIVKQSLLDSGTVTASVNGGPGFNQAFTSPGVSETHIQRKHGL